MPTPFSTTAPAALVVPATDAQINFIVKLIDEREWNGTDLIQNMPGHVARVSVLRMAITWAMNIMDDATPPAVSRMLNDTVGRSSSYGERVNAIFIHLSKLAEDRGVEAPREYKALTKDGASKLIEWLKGLPFIQGMSNVASRTPGEPTAEEVPAGRYAVETEVGASNGLAFYKVDRPTEGRWAGYVFVKLMVSDEEQRLGKATSTAVLAKIAAVGAEAASARYGHEIGRCGMCDRTLTNDESRERGIGPVCAAKAGW